MAGDDRAESHEFSNGPVETFVEVVKIAAPIVVPLVAIKYKDRLDRRRDADAREASRDDPA
jgi:hypothetical protein